MKKEVILIALILFLGIHPGWASDLDNVLQGMLSAVSSPTAHTFSAGEKILSQMGENLYYSGYEYNGNIKILLLTYVENNIPIVLKFPNPDTIRVKNMQFKIINFNNQQLQLQEVSKKY